MGLQEKVMIKKLTSTLEFRLSNFLYLTSCDMNRLVRRKVQQRSKYEQSTMIHKYETLIMKSIILYTNLNFKI